MKILHISDTHGYHRGLKLEPADVLCFTGDESNYYDLARNKDEFLDFYNWLGEVRSMFKYVVYIAGNHSSFVYHNSGEVRRMFRKINVYILEDESLTLDGVNFWGSPWVPKYGNWYYMTDRNKLARKWDNIPLTTDVLMTHTPPKYVLDLTETRCRELEVTGCSALAKRIEDLNIKAHLFGHIHNFKRIENSAILIKNETIFSNATAVEDLKFEEGIKNHGNIIQL